MDAEDTDSTGEIAGKEPLVMTQESFSVTAGVIFLIIAILHVLRIIIGWDAIIGGWAVPSWVSWLAIIVAGYLAYEGFRLAKKAR